MVEHDFLGKTLYVITSTPIGPPEELREMLPTHLEHQVKIERDGILFAAGPLESEDGARRGLIIVRAASFGGRQAHRRFRSVPRNGAAPLHDRAMDRQ